MTHRNFALAAAALAGIAGLGAAAAFAHPHAEGEKGEKLDRVIILERDGEAGKDLKTRRFHIERVGPEGPGGPGGPGARRFRVLTPGGPGGPDVHALHMADCDGSETVVDETAGDDKHKTRVVFCGKGGDSKTRVERLEKALERISGNEHIDAEHKARITASLREAIEKARAAN